jgi:hypothetical protein
VEKIFASGVDGIFGGRGISREGAKTPRGSKEGDKREGGRRERG